MTPHLAPRVPAHAAGRAPVLSGPPPLPAPAPPREPTRVWIVEDDPHYRDVFGQLVGRVEGVRLARSFGSVEEALGVAREPHADAPAGPGLILLDVNLPGMSGLEGIRLLREAVPPARVVMLTVQDDVETIFAALRAGASGYLLKDSPVGMLMAGVEQAAAGALLMPPRVAARVLAHFDAEARSAMPDYGLSARERAALEGMTRGLSQKQIAGALSLSHSTVNGHVQRVYEKLGVNSASAAVAKAVREGLV